MSQVSKSLKSLAVPFIFILWVVCGVILICQYKGILPIFDQWIEWFMIIVTIVPPGIVLLVFFYDLIIK